MNIAVLVSGGVDSSVALHLLRSQGYNPTAFYLKIQPVCGDLPPGGNRWKEDLAYARAVCGMLDVPLEVVSLDKEYTETVLRYTLSELAAGRTPSPDLYCNKVIKFGTFFDRIGSGFEKVATGHYARIVKDNGTVLLKTSPDSVKDQTYFLSLLDRRQLSRLLFLLAEMKKAEVRKLAERLNLPTKLRKDSQGICLLGNIKFRDLVLHYLGKRSGDVRESRTLEKLGEHKGHWFFTIGQRTGLGLPDGPWYVTGKDPEKNTVYVAHIEDIDDEECTSFKAGFFHWINSPPEEARLQVKIRHREERRFCELRQNGANEGAETAVVFLERKDQGIAPGQYAVFYEGDTCLGCGTILNRR